MKKIGITGALASGKTTASKILSRTKGPLFSADLCVRELYKTRIFKSLISKKFSLANNKKIKSVLKKKIIDKKFQIKKLEKIIHPFVRKKMLKFIKKNKTKKFVFFEIPLLIESKLMKNFDIIFFIKSKKSLRLKRFKAKGGDKKLFDILNNKQLNDKKKVRFCDHVIVNESNKTILKKKLLDILKHYE